MNINPTAYGIYKANAAPRVQAENRHAQFPVERAELSAEKMDRLSISQTGSAQRDAGKVVRSIMQDIRNFDEQQAPALVEELRSEVAEGGYGVSSQELADAILGRAVGR